MEFRTRIPIPTAEPKIDYNSKVFLIGSCFVENIGRKLEYFKFQNFQNPFGILFHPIAIATFFKRVTANYTYSEKDIFYHNERWHCFEAHSDLSSVSKEELIHELNKNLQKTREFIENATHVVITLGTAFSYKYIQSNNSVANCHKLPQADFKKHLCSPGEVSASMRQLLLDIKSINSEASVIATISPVRHTRDGFVENQWSKSNLISGLQKLISEQDERELKLHYFPSYEIMMDELRDYRFYTEDMLHPNEVAVNYIWKRFTEAYISDDTSKIMAEVEKIQKGLSHKAFNPSGEAHKKFLNKLNASILKLSEQFPHIYF